MKNYVKNDWLLPLLASRIVYVPHTGELLWKTVPEMPRSWNARYAGKPAGTVGDAGYILIRVTLRNKPYHVRAHRLAFFIAYGVPPSTHIDHKNGNRRDNCLSNLQEAPPVDNSRNQKKSAANKSGHCGVRQRKATGRWEAYGVSGRKSKYLGVYEHKEDAVKASLDYRASLGYSQRHLDGVIS